MGLGLGLGLGLWLGLGRILTSVWLAPHTTRRTVGSLSSSRGSRCRVARARVSSNPNLP